MYEVASRLQQATTDGERAAQQRVQAEAARDEAATERDRLRADNDRQRTQISHSTEQLDQLETTLSERQADVARQSAVSEALRSIGDVEVRRRSRGYSSASDLVELLASSATLRASGRRAEAQASITDALALQPRIEKVLPVPDGPVAIIDGGERILTGGSPAFVWDMMTGRQLAPLPEAVAYVSNSADGTRFLTVTRSGEFRVRDARSLELLGQWNCVLNQGPALFALSGDGSNAAVPCGGGLRIVNVATGGVIRQLSIDDRAQMMDLRVGAEHVVFSEVRHGSDLYRLFVYPLHTGGRIDANECIGSSRTFISNPTAELIASICDESSFTGGFNRCAVVVCRPGATEPSYRLPTQQRSALIFSDDGRFIATSEGGLDRVWLAKDGRPVSTLDLRVQTSNLSFSHDGSRLIGSSDDLAWVADVDTGSRSLMVDIDSSRTSVVGLSGDGTAVITRDNEARSLQFWRAGFGAAPRLTFEGVASRARFSPDGQYLIASGRQVRGSDDDERSKVWDVRSRKEAVDSARQISAYQYSGVDNGTLAFLERLASEDDWFDIFDDGRLAMVGLRGSRALWDLRNRRQLSTLKDLTGGERPITMADGRHVVTEGSNVVDLRTGAVVFTAPAEVLAVTRSGRVATGEFGLVHVWQMGTRELEARLRVDGMPRAVAFSPDEHDIAIAADVHVEIRKWQLDDAVDDVCELLRENAVVQPWRGLVNSARYRAVCGVLSRSTRVAGNSME